MLAFWDYYRGELARKTAWPAGALIMLLHNDWAYPHSNSPQNGTNSPTGFAKSILPGAIGRRSLA